MGDDNGLSHRGFTDRALVSTSRNAGDPYFPVQPVAHFSNAGDFSCVAVFGAVLWFVLGVAVLVLSKVSNFPLDAFAGSRGCWTSHGESPVFSAGF